MKFSFFAVRLWAVLLLGAFAVAGSGCLIVAAGAAGAGTVAYVRGDLQATLDADYEDSLKAARGGLDRMKYLVISERSDALAGEFIARTALDQKVQVRVTKESDALTKIRIRVGIFGDEEISRALLDAIKARI
jgi:hypothetical protein